MQRHPILSSFVLLAAIVWGACAQVAEAPPEPVQVPVRSEILAAAAFRPSLTLYGKVEPAERVEVLTPESGLLRYAPRFANGLRAGERVREGEPLFSIDNERLRLAQAEAAIALRSAEAELETTRRGVEIGIRPEVELRQREIDTELARERLASAEQQLARLEVTAPRSGVLWVERVTPGGTEVAASHRLAEIAGDGMPRVEAWATPADLDRLTAGLEALCRRPGRSRVAGIGALAEVTRRVDPGGTVRLVVQIDEDRDMPPPGEGLEIEVLLEEREAVLTLPEPAVLVDGGVASVYVLEPHGTGYKAQLRSVRAGSRADGRVEILDGLREGERVAVQGVEFLADGLLATEVDEASQSS